MVQLCLWTKIRTKQWLVLGARAFQCIRAGFLCPRWPKDISSAADNAIFKNRAQNIECSFGCMARSAVPLKPNVANILLFKICKQKFVQQGPITIAIDCDSLSLLIFEEKWPNYASSGPKSAPNSDSFWVRGLFNVCWRVFGNPKCDNFACLHTRQDQNELRLKRWCFFAKIGIFCKSCVSRQTIFFTAAVAAAASSSSLSSLLLKSLHFIHLRSCIRTHCKMCI